MRMKQFLREAPSETRCDLANQLGAEFTDIKWRRPHLCLAYMTS